jgi:hypothetical protein
MIWPLRNLPRARHAFFILFSLILFACGRNEPPSADPQPDPPAPVAEPEPARPEAMAPDERAAPVPEPETRAVGVTAHLEGFEVEVKSVTFTPRTVRSGPSVDEVVQIETLVEIETAITNLIDQNRRGPTYGFLKVGEEQIPPTLQPPFIPALGMEEVVLRFEVAPGVGPDDTVLWFVQRDRGNPAAIPLGNTGPTHTLSPIEIEFTTPEPFGDIVFEGTRGRIRFYGDGHRQLAGYAFVELDLSATNTGDQRARINRFSVQVDGVGVTPGGDPLRAGNLVLGPKETREQAVRMFQIPLYGERITLLAQGNMNEEPVMFLDVEVAGLHNAIPAELRPSPPE